MIDNVKRLRDANHNWGKERGFLSHQPLMPDRREIADEIDQLRSLARIADKLVHSMYEFPDDPAASGCWLDSLAHSLDEWKSHKEPKR